MCDVTPKNKYKADFRMSIFIKRFLINDLFLILSFRYFFDTSRAIPINKGVNRYINKKILY